mmetsp:Transcript_21395/g.59506  ORF Transcript_21395/g.59506 Transcript_21395/m.59506 type:complete len:240 (+) Transcript_21395:573-1292(+)
MPCPPPMHAAPTWILLSGLFANAWARCAVIRDPLAPSGCPMAIALPWTLVLSMSRFSSLAHAKNCAAKASLISTRSTSFSSDKSPAFESASRIAGTGPMPMILGSHPTMPYPASRHSGVRSWSIRACSDATMMLPAPSLMPLALAAVTTPCSRSKTAGKCCRLSRVASGRGCSSVSIRRVAPRFLPGTSMGAISASKSPFSLASAQPLWLRRAWASHSSRVIPYCLARFSAVIPMGVLA